MRRNTNTRVRGNEEIFTLSQILNKIRLILALHQKVGQVFKRLGPLSE